MSRNAVRGRLERDGVRPSRQLGQNFLVDDAVARAIVDGLEAGPEDCVVEVGPGTGALTRHVVGRVRRLVLVEFDRRLAGALREEYAGCPDVEVVEADAAHFDLRPLFREGAVKFLGNLPYSAGAPILKRFLTRPTPVARAVVMLQKEFVDRMRADAGDDAFGAMSVRIGSEWRVEPLLLVPPDAFLPRPRVDSLVVRMERLAPEVFPVFDPRLLDRLLRMGFAQRRKQLHKQLPGGMKVFGPVAEAMGLPPTTRAEQLSVARWIELARRYDPHPLKDMPQNGGEMFDVVDERDEVVGRERRDVVHRDGLRHRAVHVFVRNRRGEVFLQKRSHLKDKHPGEWDSSAAGHLEVGEDYAAAAVRELAEELGITGAEPVQVARVAACPETGMENVRLFECEWNGAVRWPCAEIETGVWMRPEMIDDWVAVRPEDFAPGFRLCWRLWRQGS